MSSEENAPLINILEALLLASEQPLTIVQLHKLVATDLGVEKKDIRAALELLDQSLLSRACELREVAGGYRVQIRQNYSRWVNELWQEKPPRFSRALLETLALVVYRQPVTRGEIEDVRGVQVSSNILRTLLERGWIREVGVKEVPGRPALFGTTAQFLDDFNLKNLDQLPSLPEIRDPDALAKALEELNPKALSGEDDDPAKESDESQSSVSSETGSDDTVESTIH